MKQKWHKKISAEITLEETKEIINKCNAKVPERNSINIELIKYGGEAVHQKLFSIIKKIREEESMPTEWNSGQIIIIHKKGDQQICNNYREITLLNTAYNIMSAILQRRLTNTTKHILGQYHCEFTQGNYFLLISSKLSIRSKESR